MYHQYLSLWPRNSITLSPLTVDHSEMMLPEEVANIPWNQMDNYYHSKI